MADLHRDGNILYLHALHGGHLPGSPGSTRSRQEVIGFCILDSLDHNRDSLAAADACTSDRITSRPTMKLEHQMVHDPSA